MLVSLVLTLAMGGVGYGVAKVAKRSDSAIIRVAVIGGSALGFNRTDSGDKLVFLPATESDLYSLRNRVKARKLDGVLVISSTDSARLIVRRNPVWKGAVEARLSAARQKLRLAEAGLAPEDLASMLAPLRVATEYQSGSDGRAARITALAAAGLVLYGVFISMAYMMVSVTAEKQLRVTEQVISAIQPQTWIDGKIIGISAVAFVNLLVFVAGAAVWLVGRSLARGSSFSMGSSDPITIIWILVFALLGFLFWLSVFGAVAATIDDPNSSTRGPLMFLPAVFSFAGFVVVPNPDSLFARITGLIPLTSSAVMPARMAVTDVPAWERLLAALLLVGAALIARRVAGKVFSVAMLMYGKEPSWAEIRRWARES
jgi:ABC-2 type transport system permease protein